MTAIQEKADALFEDQKTTWPLLGVNWAMLKESRVRKFRFEGFSIHVQYNPKRIVSSAAKVDKLSIENRSCFLCPGNRPPEEKYVHFGGDYEILCNPFPIFQQHFTIAKREHTPQVIRPEFSRYLDLSKGLPDLVVFYNAPACGASAPDHMHFQAGNRGLMPIESEIETIRSRYGRELVQSGGIVITAIGDGLRRFLLLESSSKELLEAAFSLAYDFIRDYQQAEPMLNMLCYYNHGWQLMLFPRELHRPWQYFEEGDKNIVLSPAAVDMGGTLITPLEKDFNSISEKDIEDIFSQIICSADHFKGLSHHLQTKIETHGT
jgi:hypothetical protein